jgi:uncharacterized protein (TIGR04255 family)
MAGKHFRLKNPPLIHVLIQVVVDPYLKIGTRIPDLQEALRPLGFVDFQEAAQQHLNFDVTSGEVQVGLSKHWYFLSKDRSTRLSVGQNSVVLQRTTHTHFEDLKELLVKSIRETSQVWPEGHQVRHRLGLRYVNLLIPKDESVHPARFVAPGFQGIEGVSGSKAGGARKVECFAEFDRGQVAVRYSDVPGQPPLPPGIEPIGMMQKLPLPNKRFALLDIDRYEEKKRDYSLGELEADLTQFNKDAEQTLLASCTKEALEDEWGIEYLD